MQEAARIGLGTYKVSGANGFTSRTLLQLLTDGGFAGSDLPGATALDSSAVLNGKLGTDATVLTSFDMDVVTGFFYYDNDASAATNNDRKVGLGETMRVRDASMSQLKNYRFFCDAGTAFDLRIQLMG